jgi:hypothetical protein
MRTRLALLSIICVSVLCAGTPPGVAINYDPHRPTDKSSIIWLAYLIARCGYREEHKMPLPASAEIIPSFDEEVYARKTATRTYCNLKGDDKTLHDSYWEAVSQVERKGYMKPYVWVYFRRSTWPENERPDNLATFENWRRSALRNHRAVTFGSLSVQR